VGIHSDVDESMALSECELEEWSKHTASKAEAAEKQKAIYHYYYYYAYYDYCYFSYH
jgi:hypothetical protein